MMPTCTPRRLRATGWSSATFGVSSVCTWPLAAEVGVDQPLAHLGLGVVAEDLEHGLGRVVPGELLVGRPGRVEAQPRLVEGGLDGVVLGGQAVGRQLLGHRDRGAPGGTPRCRTGRACPRSRR